MPDIYYDGNFTEARMVGQPIWDTPFLPHDSTPYSYKQRYWQLRSSFAALAIDVLGPYLGFHVGETGFNDEGGGVISFNREFALLPATRNEYESFVYSYQVWATGASGGIEEFPRTVKSRIQFDYFHVSDPITIELPRAPRLIDAFNVLYPQNGYPIGGWPDNTEILAEDATVKRWKSNIYERRQRFVRVPSHYSFLYTP